MSAKRPPFASAKRVLAVRLDTIGDVIMTTPALAAIAETGAQVTLLTSSVSASLASMLPYLHDVITVDVPWMKPAEKFLVPHGTHLAQLDDLRSRAFDAAVIFNVSTQDPSCAAYLCYLSGIPRVAAQVKGKLYGLLTDPVPDLDVWPPRRHEVMRHVQFVETLGYHVSDRSLRVRIPRPSPKVRAIIRDVSGTPWCVIHPGATAPSRRYPNEAWSQVIDLLHARGIEVVLAGGKQDVGRCAEIAMRCSPRPLRADGRLTLPELASLLKLAPAAATCNSSAAHLCACSATPVTTLYAGTNPQHRPWMSRATVLRRRTDCAWCLSSVCPHGEPPCISLVTPQEVARSVVRHVMHQSQATRSTTAVRR